MVNGDAADILSAITFRRAGTIDSRAGETTSPIEFEAGT
jgi:hypothetical protein